MSDGFYEFNCLACDGEGSVQVITDDGLFWEVCPECSGSGRVLADPGDDEHLDYLAAGMTPLSTPGD